MVKTRFDGMQMLDKSTLKTATIVRDYFDRVALDTIENDRQNT